ncbi:pyridoxal-phosphate dependent enzyme [Lacinutrix sp. MedPE-SW]|uniref:pyridoxal-phosphate dependent enzyme n=1 Tax=Lacinutrix sp. MedPE-SW TaxID=1860087 RepID=UPI0009157154|nr:pyridoxal-phosphate dependent enzyme [Lacinutrix sp. MedPE-SW]OIQ18187.1 MAG: serine dehydratase [Lacinutrix sp. MedPE-SW]
MNKDTLLNVYNNIQAYIHKTPVLTSRLINEIVGAELYFKCENFQKMGAFKMRGATNAIMQLNEAEKQKGVVTHSSGNFAQALSLAAKSLGVTANIVMPKNAPQVKKNAVLGYNGVITECDSTVIAREREAAKISKHTGATFVHPSNDINVILGNSTATIELLEDYNNLDIIVSPVGGGGLIAGTALAAHYFKSDCEVVGAEPIEADDAYRSLISGKIETNETVNTIADGLRTQLGDINFPIIQQHVKQIVRVEETEIIDAMRLIYERLKLVVETSSATTLAAIIKEKHQFSNKKIGVILSGGNVDLSALPF